jgi:N-acetylglucosaminyldiphosphoundecaprenol N-acetyl-beta-D-mannosaminyltransferase
MISPRYITTLGFKVFSDKLSLIPIKNGATHVINTISPNSYGLSTIDKNFNNALKKSDYLVLDGVYFTLASIMLQGKNIQRNQGPNVFYHFLERLKKTKGKAFFLGSSPQTLKKIEERIKKEYPEIRAEFYSPPFKSEFNDEDNASMISAVNNFKPDVLFVGLTCPKQEKWSIQHKKIIEADLIICIGNVFDWFAGTQKSIHPIWFKIRMGWLVRIFLRPEIFRRNIRNQMKFFTDVLLLFLRLKKIKNG